MNPVKPKYMLVGGTRRDRISIGSNVTIVVDTSDVVDEVLKPDIKREYIYF